MKTSKMIYLLNIGQYAPEVTRITYPYINLYAKRIGAEIHTITERKFPDWPVTYEKLQIHDLAQEHKADWNLYVDSDCLIHPECPDFTIYLPMGTVAFHSSDVSHIRFRPDEYNLRNGRYIAPGNWFMVASKLCLDLWRPLDMTPAQAMARITPTPAEKSFGMTAEHLVDDFALTQNIARFGLAFKSFEDIFKERGFRKSLYHEYTLTIEQKAKAMSRLIQGLNPNDEKDERQDQFWKIAL